MSNVMIGCRCCGGVGKIELTGVAADTLKLLKAQKSPLCGAELAELAGCSGMAMCNRLVLLERHGLAKATRYGVKRLWQAVKHV
jgi:hypothetical protein